MAEGESLSSIALGAYGDARLWFRIAQANALDVAPTAKLMAGQVLQVPAALAAGADAQGFRPYDPSAVIGDQSAGMNALSGGFVGTAGLTSSVGSPWSAFWLWAVAFRGHPGGAKTQWAWSDSRPAWPSATP